MNRLNVPNSIRSNFTKLFAILLVFTFVDPTFAQDKDANPGVGEEQKKMMETQFFMQQLMMLGHDEDLRKELEVIEDQVEDVKKLAQNYQKDMMKFHVDNREEMLEKIQQMVNDGNMEEARELGKKFQQKNAEFSQSYMDKAAEVLLPHQIERLKQIAKQQIVKMTNQYSDEFGMASSMAKELELTPDESKKLNETIKEAREEYYEAVEAAKKKANEKIMSVLTIEQKERMKEILGDIWDPDASRRKTREKMMERQKEAMKKRGRR